MKIILEINKIYNEDCLEGMKHIDDKSIDMILCDLPYGTTACKWDTIIPFDKLWEQYERIIKDNGMVALFGSQPFTSVLVMSNPKMFKRELIWKKNVPTGFFNAKMVERSEEEYKKSVRTNDSECNNPEIYNSGRKKLIRKTAEEQRFKYPTTVCDIAKDRKTDTKLHPTQKPIKLMEYLIKSYTNEGELVLDNCKGSGTTAVACINTKRNFIGFELDTTYCGLANKRIENALNKS